MKYCIASSPTGHATDLEMVKTARDRSVVERHASGCELAVEIHAVPVVQPDGRVIIVADAPPHVHHGVPRHSSERKLRVLRDQNGELRTVDLAPLIKSHRYAAVTNQFLAPVRLAADRKSTR